MNWMPIETAPRDGRPIWVRGWDWGKPNTTRHFGWAYWDGSEWSWATCGSEESFAQHLTDWLPDDTKTTLDGLGYENGGPVPDGPK